MQPVAPRLLGALKCHGGKHYHAQRYVSYFPEHSIYLEPYFGSGAVLFSKPASHVELANDLDESLMNLWMVIRDRPQELYKIVADCDFDEDQFLWSLPRSERPAVLDDATTLQWAAHAFIVNRMSRGGMGREYARPGAGDARLRRGLPDNVSAWKSAVDRIEAVSARICHVVLTCQPALDLIIQYRDLPDCVIFLDPTYLPCTRTHQDSYRHEMTGRDHMHLLDAIRRSRAAIYLCGYPSDLYSEYLPGWNCVQQVVPNHSGQNNKKQDRVECLWSNRPLPHTDET